jgi:hypothetical protein
MAMAVMVGVVMEVEVVGVRIRCQTLEGDFVL